MLIDSYFQRHSQLYVVLLAVMVFLLVRQAPVNYTDGDSEHVLLTAQAIVQHGTIKLDAYIPQAYGGKVLDVNGHLYSYQPLGTSFFAVPAVWLAHLRGETMLDPISNRNLQKTLAALTVSLIFVLIYLVARCFTEYAASLLLAVVFTLGSSVASTLGAALWSHNLAMVFALLAVLFVVYDAQGRLQDRWAFVLGGLLFGAYFVRPTMLALVVAALVYLSIWRRPWLLRTALGLVVPSLLMLAFFWIEYGQILPYYYQLDRLRSWPTPQRVYGLLLSPGRGLLVYNPALILVLLGTLISLRRLVRQSLFWLAMVWLVLYVGSVSRWGFWWGGWSYGSRMLLDAMPALLLLTLLVWVQVRQMLSPAIRNLALTAFVVLAIAGVFVNTAQGLFNPWTRAWNAWYRSDEDAGFRDEVFMFDWRYPQFLASPDLIERRNIEYRLNELEPLHLHEPASVQSEKIEFQGWYDFEPNGADPCRWSEGTTARLSFRVEPVSVAAEQNLVIEISAGTHHTQTISVLLNQTPLGVIDSQNHWEPGIYSFPIAPGLLRTSAEGRRVNELQFLIPNAHSPASRDPDSNDTRSLGLCLWQTQLLMTAK